MKIEFDPAKDRINRLKHGISLAAAAEIDLERAVVVEDRRFDYGERRFVAYAMIGDRLHVLWFTRPPGVVRVIGLRRATAGRGRNMGSRIKKPADISQRDWDSVDVPEVADEEFARARPFKDVFPEEYAAWKRIGRPPVATPKVHIGFRLAADVVNAIRASGRGYNARVERVLRDALAKGEI